MQDKSRRCDACGAEAWVTVQNNIYNPNPNSQISIPVPRDTPLELDFCIHHYNANSMSLSLGGWHITADERSLINEKPSVSV